MRRCATFPKSIITSSIISSTATLLKMTSTTTTATRSKGQALLPNGPDPEGLREFSVVYTDRSLNHMSKKFQKVMNDLHGTMTKAFNTDHFIIVPGSGTYGMEAVARQFCPMATKKDNKVLVLRNGFFSFRWSQIFEQAQITEEAPIVMNAVKNANGQFLPAPIDEVVAKIKAEKPKIVFAPFVDTSDGIMLTNDYIKQVTAAVHSVGGLFALDCIASGMVCPNMKELGVDIIISAPQKGWSGSAFAGLILMNNNAKAVMDTTTSSSFSVDLKKWHAVMTAYLGGAHMYHATMPTDSLIAFRNTVNEIVEFGVEAAAQAQIELGKRARELIKSKGFKSVAADEVAAPGVIVCFTDDENLKTGKAFGAEGYQIAAGVPLQIGEGADFKSFRFGLFGMDKLKNIDVTLKGLEDALDAVSKK